MSKPTNGTYRFTWISGGATQTATMTVDDTSIHSPNVGPLLWSNDPNGGKFCSADGLIAMRCIGNGTFIAYYDHGSPVVHDTYSGTCEKIS